MKTATQHRPMNIKDGVTPCRERTYDENCDGKSVEELGLSFHSQMMILQEKHIPSKMSKPQTSMPWINGDLKKKIRRNNRLFKSRKKSQKHRSNFLKNRRNLQKQMRQARWDHINGIITQEGDKARKGFWRYVKQFKKDNTGITVLKKDGRSATSPQQKAEMLNAQFSSVFTEEDTENLPQLSKQYPSLSILSVSAIGVEKLLLNLNASKAAGPDKLSGKLLKATAHEIAPVLQVIFQRSTDEGTLPQAWKEATISPVYKKECRSNPANYRPVSLTCILCKILEHIINRHILDHLDEHRILVDAQHGFRKRRSYETQLILTCHDLPSKQCRRRFHRI